MKTFLTAKWENIVMVNYEIDPSYLLPYLPKGVELDYYEGKTYISLVGFLFKNTSIFKLPIPFFHTFEEVNLRFYVVRKDGDKLKRGVVFINETVPSKIVAFVANKLYKEHYTSISTKRNWTMDDKIKTIEYQWKVNGVWNNINVNASVDSLKMIPDSMEHYIFEHYFGYTKVTDKESIEYKINHPSWKINTINTYDINCDFEKFYGTSFGVLNQTQPSSVMIAEGSDISIDWKRSRF